MLKLIYYPIFLFGYLFFKATKKTLLYSYASFRKIFVLTHGQSNDNLSKTINAKVGKYNDVKANGILGNLSQNQLKEMVAEVQQNGYFIFDTMLPETMIKEIYTYASNEPVTYLDIHSKKFQESSKDKIIFDAENAVSPRYDFTSAQILKCPKLQQLIFDASLLAFAQAYLGCKPILDLVAFWWSAPFQGKAKSAAAQMYHFDLDRIKFLKFFFYLTDVDTDTGPFCYVKGSHKTLPPAITRDGRFEDNEIETIYGKENILELCGKRGTIMAVDTRGFHKGKDLLREQRLMFQIEFANSMFGQAYSPCKIDYASPSYQQIAEHYSHTYQQIFFH